jgi:hypothetical protein
VSAIDIPCKLHGSKAGERCNVRVVLCSDRRARSRECPKCKASIGFDCINLSPRRFLWQTWTPAIHRERREASRG